MKILINTSTLVQGGALQVAVSFINELLAENHSVDFSVICSKSIERELSTILPKFPANFYIIEHSPAKLKTRKKTIKILDEIEKTVKPNVVFTVFGPSYWTPNAIHVCGFADGWCYYPESIAFKKLSLTQRIKMYLTIKYKLYHLKKSSNYIVVETVDAQKRLAKILNFGLENIFVVGNSYNRLIYEDPVYLNRPVDSRIQKDKINVLTVSSYYPHKNLEIINRVLNSCPLNSNVRFVLTIKDEDYKNNFDSSGNIINLGPISVFDCPSVYNACDFVLMPSLLETFSANYPEAMVMKKPILTTDLPFAREVCGNAALFYQADDEFSLGEMLEKLINSQSIQRSLISNGLQRVREFTSSDKKATDYLNIINQVLKP